MKIRTGLLNNEYNEEAVHQWPENTKSQAGGGSIDGIGSVVFFEVFIEGISYIRGEGTNLVEAENAAWKKYQVYLNCNHEFERFSDTSELGKCKHCHMKKDKIFKMLTTCNSCGKNEVKHNIGYEYYCHEHYLIKVINKIEACSDKKELMGEEKHLWCDAVLTELGAYENLADVDIYDVFMHHYSGFFEYLADVCRNLQEEHNPTSKLHFIDVLELIEADETMLKTTFNIYIYKCKGMQSNKNMTTFENLVIDFVKSK